MLSRGNRRSELRSPKRPPQRVEAETVVVGGLPEKPLRRPVKKEKCVYTHFTSFYKVGIIAMSTDECDLYNCVSFYRVRIETTKVSCPWTPALRFTSIVFTYLASTMYGPRYDMPTRKRKYSKRFRGAVGGQSYARLRVESPSESRRRAC